MKLDLIETHLKPRDYTATEVVRIVNPKQAKKYIQLGIYPIDMYVSYIDKTDTTAIVMIFLKEDTKEAYEKWLNYEL